MPLSFSTVLGIRFFVKVLECGVALTWWSVEALLLTLDFDLLYFLPLELALLPLFLWVIVFSSSLGHSFFYSIKYLTDLPVFIFFRRYLGFWPVLTSAPCLLTGSMKLLFLTVMFYLFWLLNLVSKLWFMLYLSWCFCLLLLEPILEFFLDKKQSSAVWLKGIFSKS